MREFEQKFPAIADKYFDMRFDGTIGKRKERSDVEDFRLFDF